jgi:threonine dehydratase
VSLQLSDIQAAAERIRGRAVRTPLIEARAASAATGGRIFVKPEVLQRTGSFKFRGAMNRLAQLSADERKRGVVAFSSGNHAQGVAAAARDIGAPATIVMPSDAPKLKIANTKGYGAEVVLYDRVKEDRIAIGKRLAAERGLTLVPPFDDYDVMAGQGTIGLELVEDAKARDIALDAVIAPCSGGGLTSGIATAIAALSPKTRVYAVEPAAFDDLARSLKAGERLANAPGAKSICDALMVDQPGELTFPVLQKTNAGAVSVGDDEALAAMAHAFYELKLVTEPSGAVALAALLSGKIDVRGKTVAVVLSGGNVDTEIFERALATSGR